MGKINSFVKQFAAMITGDTAEVQAQKNYRKAVSALNTQIAKLKGDTIGFEEAVESAQEAAQNALVNNGKDITDRTEYVRNLVSTNNAWEDAQDALENHLDTIAFLEDKLDELNQEVDA
jgi:chromosome segregation ATPase